MDRRTFIKTVGVTAGGGAVGSGTASGDHAGPRAPAGPQPDGAAARDEAVSRTDVPTDGVEILTDQYRVSHVYADDTFSVGYGQGYVQARDRLFQMDLLRLVGRGESAKSVGSGQLGSDLSVKRDLYTEAERQEQWESAPDEWQQMIRGFTAGVNQQMQEMEAGGDMPGEFDLLGRDPGPWKPTDTIAVITYAVGIFGVTGGGELGNARTLSAMFDRFDSEKAAWEAYHDLNTVQVPETHYGSLKEHEVDGTHERALDYADVPEDQLRAIRAASDTEGWGVEEIDLGDQFEEFFRETFGFLRGEGFGSNAVIVGGEHTDTGKPMLGGGPQMSLLKPPVLHEIGLHGAGYDVAGAAIVGTPSVVVGRTPSFAWTVTTSGDDMTDTLAVELHPDTRYQYRWEGEWRDVHTATYHHDPNTWASILEGDWEFSEYEQEVAWIEEEGVRMPIVSYNEDENVAFVQRTTTWMEEVDSAFRWATVGKADNREEFEEALSDFGFGFNFHYVDEDDIAYYRTGKVPYRKDDGDPRFPMPSGRQNWDGFIAGTEYGDRIIAGQVNPERGYVVNWNNAPAPGWLDGDGELQWGSTHRVEVLERLVSEAIDRTGGNLSLADVEGIVEDCSVEHPFAPNIVPYLVEAARESSDPHLDDIADELETWAETDYSYRPGNDGRYPSGGMAIWETVRHELQDRLFKEELGGQMPDLEFDPTAGSALSGAVDPHAADHGSDGANGAVLLDQLEGRTTHQWLDAAGASSTDNNEVVLKNARSNMAMQATDGWLWGDDVVQMPPDMSDSQRWYARNADTGSQEIEDGEPYVIHAAHRDDVATLDDPTDDHSSLELGDPPGEEDNFFEEVVDAIADFFNGLFGDDEEAPEGSGKVFRFYETGESTYRIQNIFSERVLQPEPGSVEDSEAPIVQAEWNGNAVQQWTVQPVDSDVDAGGELEAALKATATELSARFGSADPGDWRLENRESKFMAMGAAEDDTIPMTNRASYQQAISIRAGHDVAGSVLPPSNTGHMGTWEVLGTQIGMEPDRLTQQLDLYTDFEYKPHPVVRERVENQTSDSRYLEP